MNVALNSLWTNTNNYIGTKITEGLTPLQRKVVLFATAFFALAAVGYVFYKICCKYPPQIEVIDPKEKGKPKEMDKPVQAKEQSKNDQADQPDFISELSEKKPLDAEKPLDPGKSMLKRLFLPQQTLLSRTPISSAL